MKYEEYTSAWEQDRSVSEIEADVDEIRHEMQRTLRELESKMSPRAVAKRTVRAPVRGAKKIARAGREHPARTAMVGLAILTVLLLGWWAWSKRRAARKAATPQRARPPTRRPRARARRPRRSRSCGAPTWSR